MSRWLLVCSLLTAAFGLIFVVGGLVLMQVMDKIIPAIVKQEMVISKSSKIYSDWVSPSPAIYMQIWVWDLTNADDVLQGDVPNFVEKGPYTYREYRQKENIKWNSNGTVSYKNKKKYVFDRSLSVGSDEDTFTTANIPLISTGTMLQNSALGGFASILLGQHLSADIFITLSVKDILWGYEDPLFTLIHTLGVSAVPSAEFGLFQDRNNTDDGVYTVFTGSRDINKLNKIDRWNGQRKLSVWSTDEANMINGTDGSMNPPYGDISEPLYLFSADACRSLMSVYEKDVSYQGIELVRFISPEYVFANATEYPPNAGFCTPNTDHCLPSGLLNASVCQQGAPVVMSLPHFLYADESVILPSMSPDKEKHESYLDADPITGITMRVAQRFQINIHLKKLSNVGQTSNLQEVFFPVIWLNQNTQLDNSTLNEYKSAVQTPVEITKYVPWAVIGFGVLLIVIASVLCIRHCCQTNRDSKPV